MRTTVAVIPAKNLSQAKQRLAESLDPESRVRLCLAMLEDLLTTLNACPLISSTLVVTRDPDLRQLAEKYGAEVFEEAETSDLNAAVTAAARLLSERHITQMLYLPGDVPLLSSHTLNPLLEETNTWFTEEKTFICLAPSLDETGTNALLCCPPDCLSFSFGPQSAQRHVQQAQTRQLALHFWHQQDLALDIDTSDALQQLQNTLLLTPDRAPHTAQCLAEITANATSQSIPLSTKPFGRSTWHMPGHEQALLLADSDQPLVELMQQAADLRDFGHGEQISFSKKVFIPLTHLCRDVCHYCTFAKAPRQLQSPYLSPDEVIALAQAGAKLGCKEALFTLGDQPELRYKAARDWLSAHHYTSTLDYLADIAQRVFNETGLLPHLNPGLLDKDDMLRLKKVSASMGIMLESSSERLTQKGMPHYGSPDKKPHRRLETLRLAGELRIPFTTGILIGIGETRRERIESLLAIRSLHQRYGHIQEVIIQNFRAKPGTLMATHPEPDLTELLWTLALSRIIFGPDMAIQTPPNLNPGHLNALIQAGLSDWGGVSPLTPDHVNPEAPWPHLDQLAADTRNAGKILVERLTIYPPYIQANYASNPWLAAEIAPAVFKISDGEGLARTDDWYAGISEQPPQNDLARLHKLLTYPPRNKLATLLTKAKDACPLDEAEIIYLLKSKEDSFTTVCQAADELRQRSSGREVTYVINRNINYTNICSYKCQFCAFSKGKTSENLRGKPYQLNVQDIVARAEEAKQRGATEVCLQGGIHPEYTGQTYIDICHAIREALPDMHIHAFSPLEIMQGAHTLHLSVPDFLRRLQRAGLNTLPGTAAEILDDAVRKDLCPDKLNTAQWLDVMSSAHALGLKSTATLMFGHIERYEHIARHLIHIRDLQQRTQGFTEFVPLPFVHSYAPIYLKGRSRPGPTFREVILIHAVARLVLYPHLQNIQASWTKLGHRGAQAALQAGANDLGGTLMDESITRAAGARHGQETTADELNNLIIQIGRIPVQRTTLYDQLPVKPIVGARQRNIEIIEAIQF